MRRTEAPRARWARLMPIAAAAVIAAACGGGGGASGGSTTNQPPTAGLKPATSIGAGEGALNLIGWEGYVDPSWTDAFTAQTGCKVNAKYAGSSDEMVTLMANGGGGQYDMVSASGGADLRLIYGGDLRPTKPAPIPHWSNFPPPV